jgi:hypothetical protein
LLYLRKNRRINNNLFLPRTTALRVCTFSVCFQNAQTSGFFKCKRVGCVRIYGTPAQLRAHKSWHERPFGYICPDCELRFVRRQNLKRHIRIHNRVESHKCDICNRVFNYLRSLRRHIERHVSTRLRSHKLVTIFRPISRLRAVLIFQNRFNAKIDSCSVSYLQRI